MQVQNQFHKMIQVPNTLTLFRIVTVPLIVALLHVPNRFTCFLAALLFSAAAVTDYLDGYYARRKNLVTEFGKVMDPLADKLLVSSTLIMLAVLGRSPAWIVCLIIGRELAITGLRNIIARNEMDMSASNLGKYKTGFQIAALIPLLLHYSYVYVDFHLVGMFFLWGALVLTIWSGVDYFVRLRTLLQA